jgi:hypothetical protein
MVCFFFFSILVYIDLVGYFTCHIFRSVFFSSFRRQTNYSFFFLRTKKKATSELLRKVNERLFVRELRRHRTESYLSK